MVGPAGRLGAITNNKEFFVEGRASGIESSPNGLTCTRPVVVTDAACFDGAMKVVRSSGQNHGWQRDSWPLPPFS